MELQPRRPPGRVDRKAGAFASEIARLRGTGYTFEAIREALADVGIELSTAALRREVIRQSKRTMHAQVPAESRQRPGSAETRRTELVRSPRAVVPPPTASSSREIAEAFFNAHPSNPLLPQKEVS